MTIEIHQRELEGLIEQRMASGRFESVEDALVSALRSSSEEDQQSALASRETLEQMFARVQGLFADGELDFSRDPSPGRPVDLG